jgi:UDP-2,3-diacylglucosamine pyrophosphatase LpxH
MCQSKELLKFLENIEVKFLILNGDIFDDLRFNRLKHFDWEAFSQIRKISDHCSVIWNRGNHDIIHEGFMSCLLGVRVVNGFSWNVGEKKMFALHGDKWDVYIYKYRLLNGLATWLYNKVQEIHLGLAKRVTKWFKKKSKILTRNSAEVKKGALKMAKEKEFDAIFCGHTHVAELERINEVVYGNSGTFESDVPTFITVDPSVIGLYRWQGGKSTLLSEQKL